MASNNFRDVLAQVCNQQRVAVLKSTKREKHNFNNLTEKIGENPETLERENSEEDANALNARHGDRKVPSWQANNARRSPPKQKALGLRDIKFNSKYKVEMGTGRILAYTSDRLSPNELREAAKSCPQTKQGERRQDVGRKIQNFISRKGVQQRRGRNNENTYHLAGEVSCDEMRSLQTALEFSSE
jgi:hypothetical protein